MHKKYILFFLLCCLATNIATAQDKYKKFVFRKAKMGSPFIITIYGKDSLKVQHVAKLAFKKVDTLNNLFSDYIYGSELNELSRSSGSGAAIPVSDQLFHILNLSQKASMLSHGAFDITIGSVVNLWRKARKEHILPDSSAIRKALKKTGYRYLHINEQQQTVWLEQPGMQLDLGGIAKGYVAQAVLDFIKKKGFPIAMVNAGGDLVVGNAPPHRNGWLIAIEIPENKNDYLKKLMSLTDKAVATSGDVYQHLEWKGKQYSHIIDPKTGIGVTSLRNVTIVANDGATADWLASACSILPIQEALQLAKKFPGTGLLIAEKRGTSIYKKSNKVFDKYLNMR